MPLNDSFPKGKQENYLTQSNKCEQHSVCRICYQLSTALREPKPWLKSNPQGCLLFDPEKYWSLIHNVTSLQVLEDFSATYNSSRSVKYRWREINALQKPSSFPNWRITRPVGSEADVKRTKRNIVVSHDTELYAVGLRPYYLPKGNFTLPTWCQHGISFTLLKLTPPPTPLPRLPSLIIKLSHFSMSEWQQHCVMSQSVFPAHWERGGPWTCCMLMLRMQTGRWEWCKLSSWFELNRQWYYFLGWISRAWCSVKTLTTAHPLAIVYKPCVVMLMPKPYAVHPWEDFHYFTSQQFGEGVLRGRTKKQ